MQSLFRKLYTKYRNLILYCMIGFVGAGLDFLFFSVLTLKSGLHHQFANFISISIGIITNFFLNFYFNFKSRNKLLLRLLSFYAVGMTGWGMSAVLLWLFADYFGISVLLAKAGTIFFVTVMQYTLNKIISFRKSNYD